MTVSIVIAATLFFFLIILLAIRIIMPQNKEKEVEENRTLIHTSGIYSIIRKSPREAVTFHKPSDEEIRQYLEKQNVDINNNILDNEQKELLINHWYESLNKNINIVENGDNDGIEFYYYKVPKDDIVCSNYIKKGNYITREELYKFPQLIPPFHLGCTCQLKPHEGSSTAGDTTEFGLVPFLEKDNVPPKLPDWKEILL